MVELKVAKAQLGDTARDIVRVHKRHRGGISRHDVVKLSANGESTHVTLLGSESEDEIEMDLDTRLALGVMYGNSYSFTIDRAGKLGQLRWYLHSDSPAVWIPAWLALWSVVLGAAGAILGLIAIAMAI